MACEEKCRWQSCVTTAIELAGALVILLGVYLAFGPYQDDRTWNLRRDSAKAVEVAVPAQDPTHFRLRQVVPTYLFDKWQSNPTAFLQTSPVIFVPGHMGKWTQVINIANYLNHQRKVPVWSLDFHANPAGWHSSVLIQQAEFVAAAMESISERYRQAGLSDAQFIVIGHSMGGIVAMEAIQRLAARQSKTQVRSVILLCTPILGHPLLIEPRSSIFLENSRVGYWGAKPPFTLVLAPGETDPMVPTEVVAIPENANGATLVSGSVHNLHSSFSHVNILFSRPSLHIICKLVSAAVDGKLPKASQKQISRLVALFQKPNQTDTKNGSSEQTLQSILQDSSEEDTWLAAKLVDSDTVGFETLNKETIGSSLEQSSHGIAEIGSVSVAWNQFDEGKVHYVTGSRNTSVFDLVLFEEPRTIRREVEKGSRGEDFDETDVVNCTALATVWVGPIGNPESVWQQVKPFSLQYPAKVCMFRYSAPLETSLGTQMAVAIRRHKLKKNKKKRLRLSGFAQWHVDFLADSTQKDSMKLAVFTNWHDWLKALIWPQKLTLPIGRAAVTHISIPSEESAAFYPFDIHVVSGFSAPWGLSGLFLASDLGGTNVHVGAIRNDTLPSSWGAETNPRMFAPRFIPGRSRAYDSLKHPLVLVVSDPSVELTLHVTANIWSALIRMFRTYLGSVVASLSGAMLILTYSRVSRVGKLLYSFLWALVSSILTVYFADAPQATHASGYSPGPPPFLFVLLLHVVSTSFAILSLRLLDCASKIISAICACCSCLVHVPVVVDVMFWVIAIGVHPAVSLLALNTRGVLLLGSFHRMIASKPSSDEDRIAGLVETARWLAGMVGMQFIYTLFYTPSIILTGWLLNGQHKEASASGYQDTLDADLKVSRHMFTPFVDSYLLEQRDELRQFIALPALGLVLPVVSLASYASKLRQLQCNSCDMVHNFDSKVAMLCRCILLVFSAVVVPVVGHRPHRLWFACQPVFLLYTIIALSAHRGHTKFHSLTKVE